MNANIILVQQCIEKHRSRLLDISKRNSLVSFKHSARSRQHIRVINELPNSLYSKFLDDKELKFRALPEEDQEPLDEKTPAFTRRFRQAQLDEDYIEAIDSIDEDEEGAQDKINKINDELRNKIREELKLPKREKQQSLTNVELAKKHHINPSYEMPNPTPQNEDRHTSQFIQTLLKPNEMNHKLSGLNSYIRTDIEESGVNTLYAAFCFLEWYDSANSDTKNIAPLLLLQLEIEKKQSHEGYTYFVKAIEEEPKINLSLSERLRHNFGIQLPEFAEEDNPEDYMQKVNNLILKANALIPNKKKWKIRRFITIGRFRFARLVMFHDLSRIDISTNEIVQRLCSGSDSGSSGDPAEDYDIDTPEVEKIVPLLITSADASQHSALVDVMKGNNVVIKGPPGTGKSQTITNIIANALKRGKSVLFLAEKMAALNVVHERLSDLNLEPYCLELHSTKAKKTKVLESIKRRLQLHSACVNSSQLHSSKQNFKRSVDHITEYTNALNSNFGQQDQPVYDYLWSTQLRKDRIGNFRSITSQCKIPFEQADLSVSELRNHTNQLEIIAELKKQIYKESKNGKHPWRFIENADLSPFQQDDLKLHIENWKDKLAKIQSKLESFNNTFALSIGNSTQDINAFYGYLNDLIDYDTSTLNETFIANLENTETASALVAFVQRIDIYKSTLKEIQSMQNKSAAIDNLEEIEKYTLLATEIDANNMTMLDIQKHAKYLQEELKLWDKNYKIILNIGEQFGILSEDDNLDKMYKFAEALDYIASVPRDYFFLRTNDIIDEANALLLKAAADKQKRIQESLKSLKERYDLDLLIVKQPHKIRDYADEIDSAGFFAIFYSSYRQAKKFITLASKPKSKFDREKSTSMLRSLADNMEKQEKIEQDIRLKTVCGSSFNGIQTDFKKLQQINEWASKVRRDYASSDEFSRNIRHQLLKGNMEELDSVRQLANDDYFVALKSKIANIKDDVAPDISVEKYLAGLMEKLKKLNALKDLLQNMASSTAITFDNIAEDLPRLQNAKEARDAANKDSAVENFLGNAYEGVETNIEDIDETASFIGYCLAIPKLEIGFNIFLKNDFSNRWNDFKIQLKALTNTIRDATSIAANVDDHANICFDSSSNENCWLSIDLKDLIKQLSEALSKPDTLNQWVRFNKYYAEATGTIREPFLEIYDRKELDFDMLPMNFEYMIYSAVASEIYKRNPVLKTSGLSLEQARSEIKRLNQEILKLEQQELRNELDNAKPLSGNGCGKRSTWTEGALINNEINKQRNHIPIRDLMKRAGKSIQQIKPCFLMSPLSVAQHLDSEKFKFDLVVIDEASQMRPEDALGSIARTDQIVVVGDPQQLPPTPFFESTSNDDDNIEEDSTSSESIMDMALSSFRPPRILSRHYRSQHESLIAFSNYHFYDQELVLFPSPVKNLNELGLRLKYVGGTYVAKSNKDEVDAIVKAAVEFMKKYPDRSLGIATINQKQKELIEIDMDRAFIENSDAADYRSRWQGTLESFFVKNLESVQGDERDAIFISTVYGPDKNGTVMQRFGPINHANGYRRLNVLFSRAKKNMVVFTSLKPEDIKINNTSSKGIKALRGFLVYANTGVIDEGRRNPEERPDSDFEVWVKEKLESIGCEAHPQVGVAGYRIDLGVKHPKYPYGYLMGVECDGATYHCSKSARERDIIRQQVLEGLGWRIYRIWSTDWFSNSVQEFEKLKNYIQRLLDSDDLRQSLPENKVDEEKPNDLFDANDTVQLLDSITYLMIKNGGETEKHTVQIVASKGDPNTGTITKHSAIGRALLGTYKSAEIECTLPIGEVVTLQITNIDKHSKTKKNCG